MKNMTLENIARACEGRYVGNEQTKQLEVKGVVTDSRQVEEGFLFIPIKGARVDGHDFIPKVQQQGAGAVLSEQRLAEGSQPYILVNSCEQALKDIAMFYREQLTIPIVGITGSVGKTSTKEMIASVLSQKYKVLKTAGNFNNEIGLPLTILRIREEHQAAVVEMGISDFGEMHRLAKIAKPDICVITNIGICHLENLKTRDGIFHAKSEIFDFINSNAHIILNGGDDKLAAVGTIKGIEPVFYAAEGEMHREYVDIFASEIINCGLKGVNAQIHTPKGSIWVEIPIPGQHNVSNAMAAIGVGLSLGLTLEEMKAGIESVETIGGRTNLLDIHEMIVIDDCYNANPVSMKASVDVLKNGLGRTIAVLGDMGELGEKEKQLHYEVGKFVAEKKIDVLFCAGTLSLEIAKGAKENGTYPVFCYPSKEEMIPPLLAYLKEGDTILVKASHFMEYPKVVKAIQDKFA
ncbi:MAG: UDP-N-acetylmuramoyl-tripeptide--D-alanyl-D-alanine ligase [Lachnospiraceae bacterium]